MRKRRTLAFLILIAFVLISASLLAYAILGGMTAMKAVALRLVQGAVIVVACWLSWAVLNAAHEESIARREDPDEKK